MKPFTLFTFILLTSLALPTPARDLRGEVTQRTATGEPRPVAGATLKLRETGDTTLSKTDGDFRLFLPAKPRFQPGQLRCNGAVFFAPSRGAERVSRFFVTDWSTKNQNPFFF